MAADAPATQDHLPPSGTSTGGGESPSEPQRASQDNGDYLARVRSDANFAAEQVRQHQSRADQLQAEGEKTAKELQAAQEWLGGLAQYRGSATGDQIAQRMQLLDQALNDPQMKQVLNQFWTSGQAPGTQPPSSGSDSDDDEYLTDEQREIRELRQKLDDLSGQLGQVGSTQGAAALEKHLSHFFETWPVGPDAQKRVRAELAKQIAGFARNPNGKEALRTLTGEGGFNFVRGMAWTQLQDGELEEALKNRELRKKGRLGALATDGPSGEPSTGRETPDFQGDLGAAIRWAQDNPEGHDAW